MNSPFRAKMLKVPEVCGTENVVSILPSEFGVKTPRLSVPNVRNICVFGENPYPTRFTLEPGVPVEGITCREPVAFAVETIEKAAKVNMLRSRSEIVILVSLFSEYMEAFFNLSPLIAV
jgi:hypothetical protein